MDKTTTKQRRERNLDLVRRMRRGEDLMLSRTEDTFFPIRPVIKKDREALAKLYKLKPLK